MRRFVDGEEIDLPDDGVEVTRLDDRLFVRGEHVTRTAVAIRDGDAVLVSYLGRQYRIERKANRARGAAGVTSGEIRAPMPGQVVDVRVAVGERVAKGHVMLVLEAMKTQQPFAAPFDGVVKALGAVKGAQVDDGALLVRVEPE